MEVDAIAGAIGQVVRAPFTRRTWSEGVYLVVTAPIAAVVGMVAGLLVAGAVAFSIEVSRRPWVGTRVGFTGFWLVVFAVVGLPLLWLALPAARQVGGAHRALAVALLGERVEPLPSSQPGPGLRGWLRFGLGDPGAWRAALFLLVSAPVTLCGAFAAAVAAVLGLTAVSYPLWWQVDDPTNLGPDGAIHHSGVQFGDHYMETWPRALMVAGTGVIALLAVPWVIRGTVWIERLLVRALLGPGRTAARLQDLQDTRAHAVDESATTLRRIERDLHDGTQARLVALAMQLDIVRETLSGSGSGPPGDAPAGAGGGDVQRALDLVDTAHRNATDAIAELREVTRSIHPPALDRGLDAALATLAARSGVPTVLHTSIATRPSAAIETIAYFCVAELLTNVAKHSGAAHATVDVTATDGGRLRLSVTDDGAGGAEIGATGSGGLAGLVDRLRTVDGSLHVASPPGGPTVVTVELPPTSGSSSPREVQRPWSQLSRHPCGS